MPFFENSEHRPEILNYILKVKFLQHMVSKYVKHMVSKYVAGILNLQTVQFKTRTVYGYILDLYCF